MKQLLLKYVNGEPAEYSRIILLLSLGFSAGIFLATYQVAGETLFLTAFNAEADLPRARISTGILGTLSALVFAFFQKRVRYQNLAMITLFVAVCVVTVLSFGISNADLSDKTLQGSRTIIFFAFVLIGPLQSVVILIFWGLFGRVFNLRASKRLAGGIDTGTALATIIAFFSIPLITPFLGHIAHFFFVSAGAMIVTMIVIFILIKKFDLIETVNSESGKSAAEIESHKQSASIFGNRYLMIMSMFLVASVIAAIFMDYTFKIVTDQQYEGRENDLASFLSFFNAFVMICSFIIQSFFNDKILEVYGLKVTLLILPGILFLFSMAIVIIGWTLGIDVNNPMFVLFFLIIAISKLLTDALRDSLENPTFKMFFLPLPVSIRFDAQTQVEGSIKEFAAFIAGALMIAVASFLNVLEFVYLMFGVIAVWAISALMMHKEYKRVLEHVLGSNTLKKQSAAANNFMVNRLLENRLWEGEMVQQRFVIYLMEKTDPMLCERMLTKFTTLKPEAQRYGLDVIAKQNFFDCLKEVELCATKSLYKDIRERANEVVAILKDNKRDANRFETLERLAMSNDAAERKLAAQIISQNYHDRALKILIPLLRDWDQETRIEAIISCGQQEVMEPLPILVDHLSIVGYENIAISAIVKYGKKALPLLDLEFNKTGQSQNTMIDVIRIYGFIGGSEAVRLLVRKFDFPDDKIRKEVLYSLNRCEWKAEGAMTAFVRSFIEREIENTVWNLAAIEEIPNEPYCAPLKKALEEEVENNYEELFLQLALLYDARSVALVKENLEASTTESVGYALELADAFVEESLKPKLLPILDDVSTSDKIKRLENFFPRDHYSEDQVLLNMVNRDYNYLGTWTKACAIYAMKHRPDAKVIDDIVACLFSKDSLMREISAWYIVSLDPVKFEGYMRRIDPMEARRLARTTYQATEKGYKSEERLLIFEKVLFMYEVPLFNGLLGEFLVSFAELIEVKKLGKGEMVHEPQKDFILPIKIIQSGSVLVRKTDGQEVILGQGDVISDVFNTSFDYGQDAFIAQKNTVIYELDSNQFLEDMTDAYELTEKLIQNAIQISTNQISKPDNQEVSA